jgi:hypothetical protein
LPPLPPSLCELVLAPIVSLLLSPSLSYPPYVPVSVIAPPGHLVSYQTEIRMPHVLITEDLFVAVRIYHRKV